MEKLGGISKATELKPVIPKPPKNGWLYGNKKQDVELPPEEG